jgi:membrane-associated HD superfamily phosphohydrolase
LKPLPNLKYVLIDDNNTLLVIIAKSLTSAQEEKLVKLLCDHKTTIGWTLADIKGISPLMCIHHILLEDNTKPTRKTQRRLNLPIMEVVKVEILKLLDTGVIYPFTNSKWVASIHVVPKMTGITLVKNKRD